MHHFTPEDAIAHTSRATWPRLQRLWARTANFYYDKFGDEAYACRKANFAVAKITRANQASEKIAREISSRNAAGRRQGWLTKYTR